MCWRVPPDCDQPKPHSRGQGGLPGLLSAVISHSQTKTWQCVSFEPCCSVKPTAGGGSALRQTVLLGLLHPHPAVLLGPICWPRSAHRWPPCAAVAERPLEHYPAASQNVWRAGQQAGPGRGLPAGSHTPCKCAGLSRKHHLCGSGPFDRACLAEDFATCYAGLPRSRKMLS